jgi:PAS domain S-box-containing protein
MKFYFEKRVAAGFVITILVLVILGLFLFSNTQRVINSVGLLTDGLNVIFLGLALTSTIIILYLFYLINKTLTARKEAEYKLIQMASEAQGLYNNAPCGYLSFDSSFFIRNMNQTLLRWLGYSRNEVIGKLKFEDLLTTGSKEILLRTLVEDFMAYKSKGFVTDLEYEFQRKDKTSFPVIVNSIAEFNEEGEFISGRSTLIDNTERKKTEKSILRFNLELKELNKELEAFTYSVSHDLRAPLRAISGYAQMMKEDYSAVLDEEGLRITNLIISNGVRMGKLIDDLLDFSRLGRKELMRSQIDMDRLVKEILQDLIPPEGPRKLNIQVGSLGRPEGDLSMLRQVWINLISNALKYTRKKETAEIQISSHRENGDFVYSISDNGAGFDMMYAGKLFGVFQRLHKMNEFEGTGVGLALVKTIIKRHGGKVWAEAKPNEGAKFYFTLPINQV